MTIFTADQKKSEVEELKENGLDDGLSLGWDGFDDYYKVLKGQLNVVTGIPNHGKSAWTKNVCFNLSEKHDFKWLVYCPEDWPLARYILDIVGLYCEDDPFGISKERFEQAFEFVQNHFKFIYAEEDKISVSYIIEDMKKACQTQLDGVVIDPWNQIQHEIPGRLAINKYIEKMLTNLRLIARRKEISLWIVAHPSKMYNQQKQSYDVPRLYDIKGSSAWYDTADNGFTVFRHITDDDSFGGDQTEVHVQKIRYQGVNGKLGSHVFNFNKDYKGYLDTAGDNENYRYSEPDDEYEI